MSDETKCGRCGMVPVDEPYVPSCPACGTRPPDMTFAAFSTANRLRCSRDFGEPLDDTSAYGPAHWALMIAEEAGEVAGATIGVLGMKKRKNHKTAADVGDEIADVVAYCDLLAARLGLDLGAVVAAKFNRVSERIGSAVRLPTPGVADALAAIMGDCEQVPNDVERALRDAGVDVERFVARVKEKLSPASPLTESAAKSRDERLRAAGAPPWCACPDATIGTDESKEAHRRAKCLNPTWAADPINGCGNGVACRKEKCGEGGVFCTTCRPPGWTPVPAPVEALGPVCKETGVYVSRCVHCGAGPLNATIGAAPVEALRGRSECKRWCGHDMNRSPGRELYGCAPETILDGTAFAYDDDAHRWCSRACRDARLPPVSSEPARGTAGPTKCERCGHPLSPCHQGEPKPHAFEGGLNINGAQRCVECWHVESHPVHAATPQPSSTPAVEQSDPVEAMRARCEGILTEMVERFKKWASKGGDSGNNRVDYARQFACEEARDAIAALKVEQPSATPGTCEHNFEPQTRPTLNGGPLPYYTFEPIPGTPRRCTKCFAVEPPGTPRGEGGAG